MKSVNLHLLTRVSDPQTMSRLFQALSGAHAYKQISPHESACLKALTDRLIACFAGQDGTGASSLTPLPLFDGFYFSYVIEHIGKEFDLLKVSADGETVLNIELKSENIGEERIKKQLEQNRYYLSHTAKTIFSFTYVLDTDCFYYLNSHGYLGQTDAGDVAEIMQRPALQCCAADGIDHFFRSSDYLISPVTSPEKFLGRHYFLTNQQFDFKRRILEHFRDEPHPIVSIEGAAGTGKTLLLFDLALELSKKDQVLLIHSGYLREGHLTLNERLRNVTILSVFDLHSSLSGYACLMIDEADHLPLTTLQRLLEEAHTAGTPVIVTRDPYEPTEDSQETLPHGNGNLHGNEIGNENGHANENDNGNENEDRDGDGSNSVQTSFTLSLVFSGNIRINRPISMFLRTLMCLKDHAGNPDYSCIDVLYTGDTMELQSIVSYYHDLDYMVFPLPSKGDRDLTKIAPEYCKVALIMDNSFYYDVTGHLQLRDGAPEKLRSLYTVISGTREKLCLIIDRDPTLFEQILAIRTKHLS